MGHFHGSHEVNSWSVVQSGYPKENDPPMATVSIILMHAPGPMSSKCGALVLNLQVVVHNV